MVIVIGKSQIFLNPDPHSNLIIMIMDTSKSICLGC